MYLSNATLEDPGSTNLPSLKPINVLMLLVALYNGLNWTSVELAVAVLVLVSRLTAPYFLHREQCEH